MLLNTLHARERGQHAAGTSAAQRLRYASRARDFIEEHFQSCVRLEDIAQAAGVGARTLQLCFREKFGFGPMEYLRLRRLHEARRVLQRGSPDSLTVTDAPLICGFTHLGRFSHYYHSAFSELPSRVLRGSWPPCTERTSSGGGGVAESAGFTRERTAVLAKHR